MTLKIPTAWKEATWTFVLSRLVILFSSLFSTFILFVLWSKRPHVAQILTVISLIFFVVNIILFVEQS
jgi:hypothetical protein